MQDGAAHLCGHAHEQECDHLASCPHTSHLLPVNPSQSIAPASPPVSELPAKHWHLSTQPHVHNNPHITCKTESSPLVSLCPDPEYVQNTAHCCYLFLNVPCCQMATCNSAHHIGGSNTPNKKITDHNGTWVVRFMNMGESAQANVGLCSHWARIINTMQRHPWYLRMHSCYSINLSANVFLANYNDIDND